MVPSLSMSSRCLEDVDSIITNLFYANKNARSSVLPRPPGTSTALPSPQHLRHRERLLQAIDDPCPPAALRILFLRQLPPSTESEGDHHVDPATPLTATVAMADSIDEIPGHTTTVASLFTLPERPSASSKESHNANALSGAASYSTKELLMNRECPAASLNRCNSQATIFYHRRISAQARKCQTPCS